MNPCVNMLKNRVAIKRWSTDSFLITLGVVSAGFGLKGFLFPNKFIDGWMFDGEDALGQINSMSLDNQRNLKLAIRRDPAFLQVTEKVSGEMNSWAEGFFGSPIIDDWQKQLDFTTIIFRARGLHLDDRHIRDEQGTALSASIVDLTLYVVNNYLELQKKGASVVLYLPKIQTAEEAGLWNRMLTALEDHLGLEAGTIKVYVLVEQLEATFQLMEIRAALG